MYDINFFEPYIDTRGPRSDKLKIALIAVGASLGIVLAYALVNKVQIPRLNKEISRITGKMTSKEFASKKSSLEEKQKALEELKMKEEQIDYITGELQKRDRLGGHLVEIITNSIPGNIFLKSIEITEEQIEIEGLSRSKEDIAKLEANLREVTYFEDVFIPKITAEEEFFKFNVQLELISSSEKTEDEQDDENKEDKDKNKDKEDNKNEAE